MSGGRIGFGAHPATPDIWARGRDEPATPKAEVYTARLTVDVTPELRGRIRMAAFRRGVTMAVLLRELLDGAFPEEGNPS